MLAPGSRLGLYEITAALGAGGMGEVWQATDTKLGREVALKVLPEAFAGDAERMARFEREARVLASLNHPNIATLYGLETAPVILSERGSAGTERVEGPPEGRESSQSHDAPEMSGDPSTRRPQPALSEESGRTPSRMGRLAQDDSKAVTFLVMELVEGEGLDEVIARGPIPVDEAVPIALQIADALEAAHEAGIVHRDLKPANIRIRPDGTVKVLDFGLAKAWAGGADDSSLSLSPTVTRHATAAGVLLGTAAYMSPEQARGKPVDKRSDNWSFGVVLWEMLTGRKLFDGDTISDMLASVLRGGIEIDALPPQVPTPVRRVLRRCLERDSRNRLRDVGDAALELREASQGSISEVTPHPTVPRASGAAARRLTLMAIGVAVVASALALWALFVRTPKADTTAASLTYELKTFDQLVIYNARFLPEGRGIVYSGATTGNDPELFLLPPGAQSPRKLASPGISLLSVSDAGELAVLTDATFIHHRVLTGTLARMAIDGSPRPLVEAVRDADWGPDESMAIVRRVGGGDRLEYPIGTVLYETTGYVSEPRVSADGQAVAFLDHQWWYDDRGTVKLVDRSGRVTTLSEEFWGIEGLAWSSDGKALLFSGSKNTTDYQPRKVTLTGNASMPALTAPGSFTVLDVDRNGDWLAMSEEERLGVVVRPPGGTSDIDLTWLDTCWGPWLSPDRRTLLFTDGRGGSNYSVVTRRLDGSPITILGEGAASGFSPDGQWVAAEIASPPGVVLYPTGAGSPRLLERGPIEQYPGVQWFPDGNSVLIEGNEPSRPIRAYRQSIDGGGPDPVTPDGIIGRLRPDGTAVIALDADGVWKVFPLDSGAPTPVPGLRRDELVAAWNAAGSAVFTCREGDVPAHIERFDLATGKRTAALTIGPEQRTGLVRIWFEEPVLDPSQGYAYGYQQRVSKLYLVHGSDR